MKALLAVAALFLAAQANASYFRFVGQDGHVHESAAWAIDPTGNAATALVTGVAIVPHSTKDGTIMPASCRDTWCPPEDWTLLEIGGGGSARISNGRLSGDALGYAGTSANLAPQLGGIVLQKVGAGSPQLLQQVKAAMLGVGGNGVRLGYGIFGTVLRDGTVQSMKEAFPGQGPLDILRRNSRITVGYAWTW